jgi:hypothetical protein
MGKLAGVYMCMLSFMSNVYCPTSCNHYI